MDDDARPSAGTFSASDGTRLSYRVVGDGPPLICLPGGPMLDGAYLGDLGGLSAHRRLVVLDPRGTGRSAVPADATSYRCDRQVDDVERLREHLGLTRVDVLGHSAGTNLAVLHAQRHPDRVGRLVLVTPSVRALGVAVTAEQRRAVAVLRRDEPWFPAAMAALEAVLAGDPPADAEQALAPFSAGRWDAAAQAEHVALGLRRNDDAATTFGGPGAFDPAGTRAALTALAAPVLALAGQFDVNSPPAAVGAVAEVFPHHRFVVQPGAGHSPWLDDPARFVATVEAFLRDGRAGG